MNKYYEKSLSKEDIEFQPTTKKAKRKLRKWVKGAFIAAVGAGVIITSSALLNTFKASSYSYFLTGEDMQSAAIVMHPDPDDYDKVTYGYSAIGLDEAVDHAITKAELGTEPQVIVASFYQEADYAHGHEDEVSTMDEIFIRMHNTISGHEDEYLPETVATFNYPNFQAYLDANNISPADYHATARKIMVLAAKHGSNSKEVSDFLNQHGFSNDSGGRL